MGPPVDLWLHPKLAGLFAALDHEGISWCVLRGERDLLVPAGDVDLLVERRDFSRMRDVAEGLGFTRVPAWGYGSHAFFLTYEPSDDMWIKLDVVTELAFGPGFSLATGAETGCLARRRHVRGVPVLKEGDAFWALLLHRLLDKRGEPEPRDTDRLRELLPRAMEEGPLVRFVASVCPAGWSTERIVGEVEGGHWTSLSRFAPRLATTWRLRRRAIVRRRIVAHRLSRWSGKWLGISRRRGLGVALLGPDGAGKSTLAAGIERSFHFSTRYVYMGLYQNVATRPARMGVPGLGLASALATQWARWLRGAYHRRRGRLVLFDRYSYDALLPGRRGQSRRIKARRWLLAHACPPPDLVVVLDAPGEVLFARKGEHDVAILEREREAYRALLPRLPRAVAVDTARDPEQVLPEVTAAIWRGYVRRWRRRK